MSEKDPFDTEWNEVYSRKNQKLWQPGKLEFPDVSAFSISSYATIGSEVCAFDAFEPYCNHDPKSIKEWFSPGSGRFLVWNACKAVIANGQVDESKEFNGLVSVRRIFLVEEPLRHQRHRNELMTTLWAQLMIYTKVAVFSQKEYKERYKSYSTAFQSFPDYLVLLPGDNEGRENVKCIGWRPERVWYPGGDQKWPRARSASPLQEVQGVDFKLLAELPVGPVEHFEDVWADAVLRRWSKTNPYDPFALIGPLRKIFGQPSGSCGIDFKTCAETLRSIDDNAEHAFEREPFQSIWKKHKELLS